ncbi:hypothetical protein N7488_006324 [Penicillium malachiteum]|nr:hypothetical protein N7488_006324 [Penicillium malachiteum]
MERNDSPIDLDDDEVLEAFQKAREMNLCPNRIWAVAGENLPRLLPKSNLVPVSRGQSDDKNNFNNHDDCTSDFCEYSQRDFTAVTQRHECSSNERKNCKLTAIFPSEVLDSAANGESSTVWSLKGNSLLDCSRPFMEISHVWADGTGTGAWNPGEVNECLWQFFLRIAEQFQCEGIWWDTLCIPRSKVARNKAIEKIQGNYQDARITLVHDQFLRSWPWDPETACFAILMSPWFSRGWTALELAKSRKVKVLFKGPHGPILKDMDEDILVEFDEEYTSPRQEASRIISNLRKDINSLDDLLNVLGPRYTSWPKDIATISALLADVHRKEQQQDTYKSILKKFGRIAPGHLFHNATTMTKEFSWCPAKLFDLPAANSKDDLFILPNGDVKGDWCVISAGTDIEKACWWGDTHPLIKRKLQTAIRRPHACLLLAECYSRETIVPVTRALLVKETKVQSRYQYIGALYFREGLRAKGARWSSIIAEVTISSYQTEENFRVSNIMTNDSEIDEPRPFDFKALQTAIWRGDHRVFNQQIQQIRDIHPSEINFKQRLLEASEPGSEILPLHLASERGDLEFVKKLLLHGFNLHRQCSYQQTALHRAAWAGSLGVAQELLRQGIDSLKKDKDGNTALHIAAQMGFAPVARLISTKSDVNLEGCNGLSPLHFAAKNGHTSVVEELHEANLNSKDKKIGWTPLHCAAENGHQGVITLLIERGAIVDAKDDYVGWTPLHIAAMTGRQSTIDALLKFSAKSTKDCCWWTPRHFAALNGHVGISQYLMHEETRRLSRKEASSLFNDEVSFLTNGVLTSLHCKVISDRGALNNLIFDKGNIDLYFQENDGHRMVRQFQVNPKLGTAVWLLLNQRISLSTTRGDMLTAAFEEANGQRRDFWTQDYSASPRGYEAFTKLLITSPFISTGAGKDSKTRKYMEKTLLHCARDGEKDIAWLLLMYGADANSQDDDGHTPVHLALRNTPTLHSTAQILTQSSKIKSRPNTSDRRVQTEAVVRLLLEKGVEMDTEDSEGRRPLHLAIMRDSEVISRLLLEKGVEMEAKTRDGRRPLHLAIERGCEEITRLLVEKGADIEAHNIFDKKRPLHYAAERNTEVITRLLLEKGADKEAQDIFGMRPLHYAGWNIEFDFGVNRRLVIEKGVDDEAKDESGKKPRHEGSRSWRSWMTGPFKLRG